MQLIWSNFIERQSQSMKCAPYEGKFWVRKAISQQDKKISISELRSEGTFLALGVLSTRNPGKI